MRADGLDQALEWQNDVPYGLTAGLHSLDPAEHRHWADAVQAGNLYVNRTTTGAIVGRQPFGGWKRSSVGPTAKAGGPNYVLALRRWHDAGETSGRRGRGQLPPLVGLPLRPADGADGVCRASPTSSATGPTQPGVIVRVTDDGSDDEVAKALAGGGRDGHARAACRAPGPVPVVAAASGASLTVESTESFVASVRAMALGPGSGARLRLLGKPEPDVQAAAAEYGRHRPRRAHVLPRTGRARPLVTGAGGDAGASTVTATSSMRRSP